MQYCCSRPIEDSLTISLFYWFCVWDKLQDGKEALLTLPGLTPVSEGFRLSAEDTGALDSAIAD